MMRFRMCPGGRWGGIAFVGVFWTVGAIILGVIVGGRAGAAPIWFLLLWVAGAAVGGYSIAFRQALELRLEAGSVEAIYAFRTRRVPVSSLRRMRPARGGWTSTIMEVRDEPPIIVASRHTVVDFAAALQELAPDLPVELHWLDDVDHSIRHRRRS